jgi:hypothetical protein
MLTSCLTVRTAHVRIPSAAGANGKGRSGSKPAPSLQPVPASMQWCRRSRPELTADGRGSAGAAVG